jgi:hypothetical protein
MSDTEAIRKKLADLTERFQRTIDLCHGTADYYDFVENNDADYVDGYLQAEADLGRVYLKPGESAPKGRQVITTKRGRRYYKTDKPAASRMPGNPFTSGGVNVPSNVGAKSKQVKEAGKNAVKFSTTGNAFKQEVNRQKLVKKQEEESAKAKVEGNKKKREKQIAPNRKYGRTVKENNSSDVNK